MINNPLARVLLLPFAMIYGFIMEIRNLLYESGITRSSRFSVPLISVGNLAIGGAGKTPHVEYLIRLLKPYIDVGTLSRGYNRKTKGFKFVYQQDNADQVGDEPLMYARKYKDIVVAVGESRSMAIPEMMRKYPRLQTIILDDAFQHRSVVPDLNIMLTQYELPFTRDFILPAGRLRERRASYERADILIVSKCPDQLTLAEKQKLIDEIKPYEYQRVFFSAYRYFDPYSMFDPSIRIQLEDIHHLLIISAIANTSYLMKHLDKFENEVTTMEYEDHHYFTEFDINQTKTYFDTLPKGKSICLTTEKDATRLALHHELLRKLEIPIFVLPVAVEILFDVGPEFDALVQQYLLQKEV